LQNIIEIQTYCAIIACMLISLWTGKKPIPLTAPALIIIFPRRRELVDRRKKPGFVPDHRDHILDG